MNSVIKNIIYSFLLIVSAFNITTVEAGFVPYGRIFKAVKDERPYITQAQDSRTQLQLHKKILLNYPESMTGVSSYVYLGHGFLVGEVENDAERAGLVECAKSITDLNGVSYFLPQKKSSDNSTPSELEIKLKGMLEPNYPSSKLTVKVVQDTVIIIGVLDDQEQESALKTVQEISGSSKIINFLQVPQQQKMQRQKRHPLRNFFSN
ncbi:BON domain-containing protein [Maridesulfovibrio sp.]|uniref:BON domain-containing protein n=1 Tax=Maridesulfovibrio sp. TaxID=2795000 RepID=UPI0029C9F2B2|nr:BON domain-containing protein [Maridesulfovibrio sp.]